MANPVKGEIRVDVNGMPYTLRMSMNAMCEFEDKLGLPYPQGFGRVLNDDYRAIRAYIWAALREHHPEMTLKDVGTLIDTAGGITEFAEQIAKLAESARPDPADAEVLGVKPRPRKARPVSGGTGPALSETPARSA